MTLQLALADGRRANIQFQGTMDEAYKAYDGAPFRLDGTESTVCGIRYLPDPVDIREQNVTACFLDDLAIPINSAAPPSRSAGTWNGASGWLSS